MRLAAAALCLITGCTETPPAGDPARGEKLHQSCLQCHGSELYQPGRRKITSLPALRKEVERWADYYNPKPGAGEIEDLVAYLNRDFYRFP